METTEKNLAQLNTRIKDLKEAKRVEVKEFNDEIRGLQNKIDELSKVILGK